ncbi:MAG: CDP-diacylglycerol--glycerol-3-phosphate 3-phosphatidyltransferase [Acetatifactor sp.]|nr:CDP-diacylglycerol--glycerol-3-phosphate 3-phosphatidyltransferase [Acetatifactor sp.]MDE7270326.1 CDP-diacylglycerol--glycerol-3-phosphate 3-phosphatidyltransferase [Acetatifactor sp.]
MNLPNKLTIFRVILIVPFVLVLLGSIQGWGLHEMLFGGVSAYAEYTALGIFIVASLTDLLDGKIARKYNLVTNFGKFMDPLADKLLVCAAMIVLVEMGRIPSWVVVVIISREFIISGFRLIASDNGVVIAASYWGKFKTTFQMVMICMMLVKDAPFLSLAAHQEYFALATDIVMWIALALTVISLVDYLVKNRNVMKDGAK